MSLSRVQAQFIANTEPFRTQLAELLSDLAPLVARISLWQTRRRVRVVTRRKQRRSW